MNRTDGGGGYSDITDWRLLDVPKMWALLAEQHTDNHWRQVAGWRKTYELTALHLARLISYRDKLAAAWPPAKSTAAAAYLARLDDLIEDVRQTYDVAAANYSTLSTVVTALQTARPKLKKIYDEYVTKRQLRQHFEELLKVSRVDPQQHPDLGPVTRTELKHLEARARSVMQDLSNTLIEARIQIRQPLQYRPRETQVAGNPDIYGLSSQPPPIIPPVVPAAATVPSVSTLPPPPGHLASVTPPSSTGPLLSDTTPIPAPTAPLTPVAPAGTPPTAPPGFGVIAPPATPTFPRTSPSTGAGRNALPVSPLVPTAPGKASTGGAGWFPRTLPPGGIIGAPGAGIGQPIPGAQGPSRRINPIGGVIQSPTIGTTAGRSAGTNQATHRLDPDHPWETDEGVKPLIVPPLEDARVDPGPAIGLDR